MAVEKAWLESDSEDDDDEEECDHKPVQSEFYAKHGEEMKKIQSVLMSGLMILMGFIIFLSSYISLEEGNFPYNIDFMADIAYSKNKFGTPFIALVVAFIGGLILYAFRMVINMMVQSKCKEKIEEQLQASKRLRVVKPRPPKQLR